NRGRLSPRDGHPYNGQFVWGAAMRLRIIYHDNCFDGLASAAVFARFYREAYRPEFDVEYVGVTHKPRIGVDPAAILEAPGAENAIVDFKYSSSPFVTWWFDHHLSA